LETGNEGIELPVSQQEARADLAAQNQADAEAEASPRAVSTPKATPSAKLSTLEGPLTRPDTPSTQAPPSEYATSTSPTTPISAQTPHPATTSVATPTSSGKPTPRKAIPALPLVPALPKASPKTASAIAHNEKVPGDSSQATGATPADQAKANEATPSDVNASEPAQDDAQPAPAPAAPIKVAPKLWTGLFSKPAQPAGTGGAQSADQNHVNGGTTTDGSGAAPGASGFSKSNATSLAEALQAYQVGGAAKLAFLEPRGLINTGNMCYMNSVSISHSSQALVALI
jgi:ubiquitin carboxyl-terminal hydrolase 10